MVWPLLFPLLCASPVLKTWVSSVLSLGNVSRQGEFQKAVFEAYEVSGDKVKELRATKLYHITHHHDN